MTKKSNNKWLCTLPWSGFSNDPNGKVKPCCIYQDYITQDTKEPFYIQTHDIKEIFSSKFMKDLRNQFRNGEKPKGCSTCIIDEQNGYTSKRQSYLEFVKNVEFDKEPEYPTEYQLIISNACNLKCRSCTPSHSSLWQAEHNKVWGNNGYLLEHGLPSDRESVFWKNRHNWMSTIKHLEVVGGEPFYIKKWQIIWDELIEQGLSKDIALNITTNATIYSDDIIQKLSKNFKSVVIGLSIDGLENIYNYLRHPGNWDTVSKNIIKYHSLQDCNFSYSHTIGWLNSYNLPDFHFWVKKNTPKFHIWNNLIHYPRHMSVVMLPKAAKDVIEKRWIETDWGDYKDDVYGILNFMLSENPSDDEITYSYREFARYDNVRKENLLSVTPKEILPFIKKHYDKTFS